MANILGKRYKCQSCNNEVLCTKAGDGELQCCGKPMLVKELGPIGQAD